MKLHRFCLAFASGSPSSPPPGRSADIPGLSIEESAQALIISCPFVTPL
jgi:hypothetical protein